MDCFRIDESGYTGFDLLNADQRFQGAAAVAIDDDEAARLIRVHFPGLKAAELKYRAVARRPANRPRILGLLRDLLHDRRAVTYVCDKRFLLVMMMLDYVVEPYFHRRGVDFYADGRLHSLGSLTAVVGPTLIGRDAFDAVLATFQTALRTKTAADRDAFIAAVRRSRWQALPEAFKPLAEAAPECLAALADPNATSDAAMVVLYALICRMEAMSDGPYRVEHDRSKNLNAYHDLLTALVDHKGEARFRHSAVAELNFPLKLARVTQVDSRASPAVQLADLLIGAVIEMCQVIAGRRSDGLTPDELLPLFREDQIIHMLPDLDFEAQRELRRGNQSAAFIDWFGAEFGRSRDG